VFDRFDDLRIIGDDRPLEPSQHRSLPAHQKLGEVSVNRPACLGVLVFIRQILIERQRIVPAEGDFRSHRKRHVVLAPAKLLDLQVAAGLPLPEIIGWNAHNDEP
jgi:hypothetical protein